MITKVPPFNSPVTARERQAILDAARNYLGVKWLHMGRDRNGLDCAGLLIATEHDAHGIWIEVSDYSPWPNPALMREICERCLIRIKPEELEPGDIVLMYVPGLGVVHLGFYAGATIIHASNAWHAGKVVETHIHSDWALKGAYRMPRYEV